MGRPAMSFWLRRLQHRSVLDILLEVVGPSDFALQEVVGPGNAKSMYHKWNTVKPSPTRHSTTSRQTLRGFRFANRTDKLPRNIVTRHNPRQVQRARAVRQETERDPYEGMPVEHRFSRAFRSK